MFELLSKTDRRRIKLLYRLTHTNSWLSQDYLVDYLGTNNRIFISDVTELNQQFDFLQIQSMKGDYWIDYQSNYTIESAIQAYIKDTFVFKVIEAIFWYPDYGVKDLVDMFEISLPTLYRAVNRSNGFLLENYNITISTSPLQLEGLETDIRSFYTQYFTMAYDVFSLPEVDNPVLDLAPEFARTFGKAFFTDDPGLYHYAQTMLLVNMQRIRSGFYIQENLELALRYTDAVYEEMKTAEVVDKVEEVLGMEFNLSMAAQLAFGFENPATNANNDLKLLGRVQVREHKKIKEEIRQTLEVLIQLSNFPMENIDQIAELLTSYLVLSNFNDYPVHLNLYNQKRFLLAVNLWSGRLLDFLEACFNDIAVRFNTKNPKEIAALLTYQLLLNWDGLIEHIYNAFPTIKVLVISSLELRHAEFTRDQIEYFKPDFYHLDVYKKPFVDLEEITASDYDIIITNFTIPEIPGKDILAYNGNMTQLDFARLENITDKYILAALKLDTIPTNIEELNDDYDT